MVDLIETIAKALVDNPEKVTVKEIERAHSIVLELSVDPNDMGKIIGKKGRIAKAIRVVLKTASMQSDKKIILEIV